jgi:predicted transcriptional regulator
MYNDARQALEEAMSLNGVEYEIQKGNDIIIAKGIRNSKDRYIVFWPSASIQESDILVNTISKEILHISDIESTILEGRVLSFRVYYETDAQYKQSNPLSGIAEKQVIVLRAIQQLQGPSESDLIEDTDIAQQSSLEVQLVRDILSLLESEGKVTISRSHGGSSDAVLTAKGRLLLADPKYAFNDSSSTTINFSGSFQGAILNVKSTLSDVRQTIQSAPNLRESDKTDLQELTNQLLEALKSAPPENAEDAEAIAEAAKALMEAATKEKPNKTTVKITAEGLKQAAKNLAVILPEVFRVASDVATRIHTIMN